jgi:membrane-bound lytic murein transglycosylase B
MISRRFVLGGGLAAARVLCAPPVCAATGDFASFLATFRASARAAGISGATLDRALAGLAPDPRVVALDRHQPEFTLSWAQYRASRVSPARISQGRDARARSAALLRDVATAYGVDPAALFKSELIAALRILDAGKLSQARLTGSYAGAMGQPQFMPSAYLRYGVDFNGDGSCDIWTDTADVLASIGNYLARHGWQRGLGWGAAVALPPDFDAAHAGPRSLAEWRALGLSPRRPLGPPEAEARLVLPGGISGEAFLVSGNFAVIRRYNASDFYALAVGLLGDEVVA